MIKSSSSSRMRNKTNLIVGPIHVYPEEALNVQYIRRYSLICPDCFFLLGPQTVSTMRKYRPTSVGVEMIGCTMKLDNPDQDGNGEVSIRDFFLSKPCS